MCDCHSYNWQVGTTEERIVEIDGKMICLDECIADTAIALNNKGYRTVAACCGHNRVKPSIVLSDTLTAEQTLEAKKFLKKIDPRSIDLWQWRRIKI